MSVWFSRLRWLLLVGLLIGSGAGIIAAHGGGEIKIGRAPVAGYLVTVWQNPPQAKAGGVTHITVGVAEQEKQTAVLDATIIITIFNADSGEQILTVPATTEQSVNKLFYETDFVIPDSGRYEIEVAVTRAGASGQTSFVTDVAVGGGVNWLWVGLIGIVAITAFSLWRARSHPVTPSGSHLVK